MLFNIWLSVIAMLLLHEGSHVFAALALGVRIKRIGFNWLGPYIVRETGEREDDIVITLAGPFMNLACALGCWDHARLFAVYSLLLGAMNLVPLGKTDGARAWKAIRQR